MLASCSLPQRLAEKFVAERISSDPAPGQAGGDSAAERLLDTALQRGRWAIFWERLWPLLAKLATVIGLFLASSWLGLWLWLPPLARAGGLIAFAALAVAACVPLVFLRMPGKADVLRRLDRGSGLRHRPATAMTDELAVTPQDPYSLALWKTHVERARQAARALKIGLPSPQLANRDPYALRGLVLVACIATFFAAGGERIKLVAAAFDWQGVVVPANFRVDAWVIPPLYTGRPPVMLPGMHPGETLAQTGGPVAVPVNSTLVIRATGKVDLKVSASGGVVAANDKVSAPVGTEEHRYTVKASGAASLRGAGDDVTWSFDAIPDKPPTIALTKDPQVQGQGSLLLSYHLTDDYGVTAAEATFALKKAAAADGDAAPRHPLFGPPNFSLILPQARTRNGTGQTIKDLTDQPWAGAEVTMTLVAHDDGGNVGKSHPVTFRLPQRVFTNPLARALIEQRQNLALDANARHKVITALDALTLDPALFTANTGVYLGLRTIFWSLVRAKTDDDLRDAVAQLWSMAVDLEDGDMADAQTALRNAENALRQALERGAGDQEIKQLMDKLRGAMNRYMEALAQQLRNNPQAARPLDPNARTLNQRDLNAMLNRLQNLAQSGARDAARRLLDQLQQMMENLQMASPNMNGDSSQMMSELDQLGDMIRRQQHLRDRTYRQGQNRRRQHGPFGQPPGQEGQQGGSMGDLQRSQQALQDQLNKLLQEMRKHGFGRSQQGQQGQGQGPGQGQGQDGMQQLGRAGRAMGEAEGDLGDGDADSAVDAQGRALDALRSGAQNLAESMQQQIGRGQGPGQLGQSRADQQTDPLGRPLRGREYGDDSTVKVPGEIDVQRARRIIEELRKRYGEMGRSQEELDYIERLLKSF
jgi:uncharacterized protein (TIGR02302 family)